MTEALTCFPSRVFAPSSWRRWNQFSALARPADRGCFDFESKSRVLQKARHQTIPKLPLIPELFRKGMELSGFCLSFSLMYTPEFREYKQVVTDAFRKKRQEASHESWLMNPTRARIRQRCVDLAERGLAPDGEAALCGYFDKEPGRGEGIAALRKSEPEDFKVLENFLGNTSINTKEKNVELVAWLIDYPHRPVTVFKTMNQGGNSSAENKAEEEKAAVDLLIPPTSDFDEPTEPPTEDETKNNGSRIRRVPARLIGAVTVVLVGAVIVWSSFSRDECMYWDNDHYVASPCSVPRMDTPMVAMDHSRLKGFHRIGRVDTLSRYSVGRLWYVRVGDSVEVYTGGGRHPLYPDKTLKRVTDYVVNVCQKQP